MLILLGLQDLFKKNKLWLFMKAINLPFVKTIIFASQYLFFTEVHQIKNNLLRSPVSKVCISKVKRPRQWRRVIWECSPFTCCESFDHSVNPLPTYMHVIAWPKQMDACVQYLKAPVEPLDLKAVTWTYEHYLIQLWCSLTGWSSPVSSSQQSAATCCKWTLLPSFLLLHPPNDTFTHCTFNIMIYRPTCVVSHLQPLSAAGLQIVPHLTILCHTRGMRRNRRNS